MADPGTAVGVISLGLQVAQGLVKYYSICKAYDEDIPHLVERVKRLDDTLAALEAPLHRLELNGDTISGRVRDSLNSCKKELLKLDEVVKKCSEVPVSNAMPMWFWEAKNKMKYPFRKSTLTDIVQWVQLAQADLNTAMHILQTNFWVDFRDRAANQATIDDGRFDLITRGQVDVMNKIDSFGDADIVYTQRTDAIVSRLDNNQEQIMNQLKQLALAIESNRSLTPSAVSEGIGLAQSIGLGNPPTNHQVDDEQYSGSKSQSISKFRPRCTCKSTDYAKERTIFGKAISLYWKQHSHHKASCPLSNTKKRSTAVGARVLYCTSMFTYILESTVTCTWGAGGYSISQALKSHRIVSWENPAFLLFTSQNYDGWLEGVRFRTCSPNEIIRKLDGYFRDGTLSPTDVVQAYGTLFQIACTYLTYEYPTTVSVPSSDEGLALLKFLISAGVSIIPAQPPEWSYYFNPLNMIVSRPWVQNIQGSKIISSFLVEQGSTWSPPPMNSCIPPAWLYRPETLTIPVIRSRLDDNPIMSAILCRSKMELSELLKPHDDSPTTSILSQPQDLMSYLRASIGWPDGMRIVLTCMKPECRDFADYSLANAYCIRHWESVELLLQYGWWISYDMFEQVSFDDDEEIIQHLVHDIWRDPRTFGLQSEAPSQEEGDPIRSYCIFHTEMSVRVANALYDIGLRHLDTEKTLSRWGEQAHYPSTPLWKTAQKILDSLCREPMSAFRVKRLLETAHWLIDRGARIAWSHPQFQTTPAHLLPVALLRLHPDESLEQIPNPEGWWKLYCELTIAVRRDACKCACSRNGCLPVIASFKDSLYEREYWRVSATTKNRYWSTNISRVTHETLDWLDTLLSTSLSMANAVLRILTFEDLGISHTCHEVAIIRYKSGEPSYSEEEINEIHEEEEELIATLDLLCEEFEAAYASSEDPSFYNFYKGYWMNRINEFKQERDPDYVKDLEEIGVVVEPFGPELPPDFERDFF